MSQTRTRALAALALLGFALHFFTALVVGPRLVPYQSAQIVLTAVLTLLSLILVATLYRGGARRAKSCPLLWILPGLYFLGTSVLTLLGVSRGTRFLRETLGEWHWAGVGLEINLSWIFALLLSLTLAVALTRTILSIIGCRLDERTFTAGVLSSLPHGALAYLLAWLGLFALLSAGGAALLSGQLVAGLAVAALGIPLSIICFPLLPKLVERRLPVTQSVRSAFHLGLSSFGTLALFLGPWLIVVGCFVVNILWESSLRGLQVQTTGFHINLTPLTGYPTNAFWLVDLAAAASAQPNSVCVALLEVVALGLAIVVKLEVLPRIGFGVQATDESRSN